jgi:hypothetical protein
MMLIRLGLVLLLFAGAARADMYPDASNAKLPVARTNLGLSPTAPVNPSFIALWDANGNVRSAQDTSGGTGSSSLIGTNMFGTQVGSPLLLIGGHGVAAIYGETDNADPAGTPHSYPLAVGGLAKVGVGHEGNEAYAMYGQFELRTTTGFGYGGQFNALNASGAAPTPFSFSVLPVALAASCNTGNGAPPIGDCGYGVWINNDTGNYADNAVTIGEYIQVYRTTGLQIANQPSGTQKAALFKVNPASMGLDIQVIGTAVLTNTVFLVENPAGGGNIAQLLQNGNLTLKGSVITSSGFLTQSTVAYTNTTTGAQTGTLTNAPFAGNPTKWVQINDNGTTRSIPSW